MLVFMNRLFLVLNAFMLIPSREVFKNFSNFNDFFGNSFLKETLGRKITYMCTKSLAMGPFLVADFE